MQTLPNLLTLSRIVAVPVLVWLLWWPDWHVGYGLAFGMYCLMGITDYFDGYLARAQGTVSQLAKWKTAFQMISLGALVLMGAVPGWAVPFTGGWVSPYSVGFVTLWGAAALTAVTGWDYLRVGLKHMD